ncbi:ABC transporter substrate-binding protein [Phreatobacter oligotrophus]|uniref:Peptide/nickel transport system substrate-binding protein n=1 Tax=Phreatobacter oligotrophus TaxID=1122261 RepID=A0A2T4YZQ5_9HYPH|nr:ABC transporter substrate-binding protein [Phreatobacter oligotrophus]PTM52423.1 peptide/nickel transport system substrate-binding protein [Phreatobacter oligotrophus]
MMLNRRTLVKGAAATLVAAPALAQDWRGTTLRFIPQANLSSLDPIWTTATVTNNHGYYVYDTLYAADMDFVAKPQMAEGHEVLDNGLRWRFKLRAGLRFHDGEPVRAQDCIASIMRWTQRDAFGQLVGRVVDDWAVIDDRTFDLKLKKPFPLLLDALGKPDTPAFIMPERHAKTDANRQVTEMVGSGPYRFVAGEYNSGSRAVYEKFADYVPRPEPASRGAGGKVGHFQRIEWHILPDPSTAANALTRGEMDWWERPPADLQPLLARNRDVVREVTDASGRIAIMRLNHLHPPFNNPKVRAAVRMAVFQEDYMRATQGDDTSAWQLCRSLWPKGTAYYNGEQEDLMPQSIARATEALKASGYAGEKVVIINPTDFPDIGPLGQVTADILKRIGMNVELAETDWGTVIQRRGSREAVDKGGWSIFHTTGPAPGWGTPATSLLVRGQGARGWFGWWESAKAEQLTQEWLDAPDEAGQKKAAHALGRLALEEVATVPLGQFTLKTAYRRTLTGMPHGSAPYPWSVKRA